MSSTDYPDALKFSPWDKKKGKASSQAIDYQQARDAAAMAKFMLANLPSFVVKLTDKTVEKFMASSAFFFSFF